MDVLIISSSLIILLSVPPYLHNSLVAALKDTKEIVVSTIST